MSDFSHAWELLHFAVRDLACSDAPLSERLRRAWVHHLAILHDSEVPDPDLLAHYNYIKGQLRTSDGRLTIEELSADDRRQVASAICDLYGKVCRWHHEPR
jgi:hypothetical protein